MKDIIIFLNGEYGNNEEILRLCSNKRIISADGGTNKLYELKLMPEVIIGDFDSIKKEVLDYYTNLGVKTIKTIPEKDYTDFEICLCYINNTLITDMTTRFKNITKITKDKYLNLKDKNILILGGLGKRLDMSLTNLKKAHGLRNIKFITASNEICFWTNKNEILKNLKGKTFSLIPISDIKNLSLNGFVYPLKNIDVSKDIGLCSNIVAKNYASITFDKGEMYIIYDRK